VNIVSIELLPRIEEQLVAKSHVNIVSIELLPRVEVPLLAKCQVLT
jgi:hypothetical protein